DDLVTGVQTCALPILRKSTYSWPSRSHKCAPSPFGMVNGNGSTKIAERVLPPGNAAQASSYCARLFGLRARYSSCASLSAAAMSILAGCRSEEHTSELQSPDHLVC